MAVDLDENAWRTMLDVNLTGVWHTCRAGAPHLIARGAGAMILTSSIAGLRGLVGVAHYTAAKHGVVGLMRSLANELAPHNIRVNCVHPTNVDTPMIQNDAVSSAFRPDLDRPPTRAEFAEAARGMNMLAVPWIDAVGCRQRRAVPGLRRGALHHRGDSARRRGRHAAMRRTTVTTEDRLRRFGGPVAPTRGRPRYQAVDRVLRSGGRRRGCGCRRATVVERRRLRRRRLAHGGPGRHPRHGASAAHQNLVAKGCCHFLGPCVVTVTGRRGGGGMRIPGARPRRLSGYRVWRATAHHFVLSGTTTSWQITTRTSRVLDGNPDAHALLTKGLAGAP